MPSRPGSGLSPAHLCCQNPECTSTLDMTSIPVEYDTILRRLFTPEDGLTGSTLDLFKACAERGDSVTFAVLVAELAGGVFRVGGQERGVGGQETTPVGELLPCAWPYCDECQEGVLKRYTGALAEACSRRDVVQGFVSALGGGGGGGGEEGVALVAASGGSSFASALHPPPPPPPLLQALDKEEEALKAALEVATRRRDAAKVRARALRATKAHIGALRDSLWGSHREVSRRLSWGRERMDALGVRAARYRESLERVRSLRVHSDAFFIWHCEPYATINGARLGRTPGRVVEWHEVNAALGQFALLLSLTAAKLGYVFQRWRIIPFGSYSKLGAVGDERAALLELSYDGSFFAPSRLTNALKPLMSCLAELGEHVEKLDKAFRLPHAIAAGGEKVGDLAVALGKDVPWTRCMRLAATNLKWLVAYAERV